jgi:hypothetical protein
MIMGLFSRDRNEDESLNDPFEPVPLPNRDDLDENFLARDNFDPMEFDADPKSILAEAVIPPKQPPLYGIEEVIGLMRELPQENRELVVTVVKKTLESTQIDLGEIIDGAEHKEARLRDKTQTLQSEIKNLQQEIEKRNREIALLQKDLKETSSVKEKLELAQQLHPPKQAQPNAAPATTTNPITKEATAKSTSTSVSTAASTVSPTAEKEPTKPSQQAQHNSDDTDDMLH